MQRLGNEPITCPFYEVRHALKALTQAECEARCNESKKVLGKRPGGLATVRVEGTNDMEWIWVGVNDVPKEYCVRHPNSEMAIDIVKNDGSHNIKYTMYYKCYEQLSNGKQCENNIYPKYPKEQLKREEKSENPPLVQVLQEI